MSVEWRAHEGPQPEAVSKYWPDATLCFVVLACAESRLIADLWCAERLLGVAPPQGDAPCAVARYEPPSKWRNLADDERRDCFGAVLPFGERGCRYIEVWLVVAAEST